MLPQFPNQFISDVQSLERKLHGIKILISERFNKAYSDENMDVAMAMKELLERVIEL